MVINSRLTGRLLVYVRFLFLRSLPKGRRGRSECKGVFASGAARAR